MDEKKDPKKKRRIEDMSIKEVEALPKEEFEALVNEGLADLFSSILGQKAKKATGLEHLSDKEFQQAFQAALAGTLKEDELKNTRIIPEKLRVLKSICDGLTEVIGKNEAKAKVEFHPSFSMGSVEIRVASVHLTRSEIQRLKEVLDDAGTLSIDICNDERVSVSATVSKVLYTDAS